MIYLRQSTASQELTIGPFVDATDGNTEEDGLTIANTDIHIWKTGATTLAHKNSGGATSISNGVYYMVLDATDTDTIGSMDIYVHVAGALACKVSCCVLDEAVYDVLFGAVAPSVVSAADVNAQCDTAISDAALATAANLATVDTVVDGIVTTLGAAGAGLTALANATNLADLHTDVGTALTNIGTIDTVVDGIATAVATIDGIVDDILVDTGTTLEARIPAALVGGRMDCSVGAMATDVITAAALNADAITEIANGSSIQSGTAQAGSTYNNILLATAASSANDFYIGCLITVVSGTGAGQARLIADYIGATRSAVVDDPFTTAPDDTSIYRVFPFSGILLADSGLATAGAAGTITLATSAPAIADTYIGHTVFISGGTGIGQARLITAYTNTRIASVSPNWTTTPDTTSIYKILPVGRTYVDIISAAALASEADAVWDEALSGHAGAGSGGATLAAAASAANLADVHTDVGTVLTNLATIDGIVDDILVDTGTTLDAIVDSLLVDTTEILTRLPDATAGATGGLAIVGSAMTLSAAAIDLIHDEVVEGAVTLRQAVRLILSVLTGKVSGAPTGPIVFRDIGDTKDRVSVTVDASGNRSAVGTRDGT